MYQQTMFFESLVELIRRMSDYGEETLSATDAVIIFNDDEGAVELAFNEPYYSRHMVVDSEELLQYIFDNDLERLAYIDPKSCAVKFMQDFFHRHD